MKKIRTHYDNLKVAMDAPAEVIKAAYKSLSKKYHPDMHGSSAESQRIMKIINQSYSVLSDPEARRRHDEWIREQQTENTEHKSQSSNDKDSRAGKAEETASRSYNSNAFDGSHLPKSGSAKFSDLDRETQQILRSRVNGQNQDQFKAKSESIWRSYLWGFIPLWWFYYLGDSWNGSRWDQDTTLWYIVVTIVVAIIISVNISRIFRWISSPLKSWTIVTPVYIIKVQFDRVWYWPIWQISDFKPTHNYKNGAYDSTDIEIVFGKDRQVFNILSEDAFKGFIEKLKEFDAKFRAAVSNNNAAYILSHDDFCRHKERGHHTDGVLNTPSFVIFLLVMAASLVFLGVVHKANEHQPVKTTYNNVSPSYKRPDQPREAKPKYVRPATAPNGAPWPLYADYINSYPQLNTSGLSSVTVDNSRNDSDVFVKIFYLTSAKSYPVRVFYIPARTKFTAESLTEGTYDVRYRDLSTGGLSRSESFTLDEIETYNGTQYTEMSLTLYKVPYGNMETYGLSEKEF